jgi:lipid-A-disaccharide synthase
MLDAAQRLAEQRPGIRFVAPLATPRVRALFESELAARTGLECTLMDGQAQLAMAAADVVVCASGTATLEAMLINRPMVVVYRVSGSTALIARTLRLIKSPFVSLPNVMAGEALVPELLQEAVTGEAIAGEVSRWLDDVARREWLHHRFATLHANLKCNAADSAAREILSFIDRQVDRADR